MCFRLTFRCWLTPAWSLHDSPVGPWKQAVRGTNSFWESVQHHVASHVPFPCWLCSSPGLSTPSASAPTPFISFCKPILRTYYKPETSCSVLSHSKMDNDIGPALKDSVSRPDSKLASCLINLRFPSLVADLWLLWFLMGSIRVIRQISDCGQIPMPLPWHTGTRLTAEIIRKRSNL